MYKRPSSTPVSGLWLLLGIAIGAAACCGLERICAPPTRRKVRRGLMHAADAVNDAIDNMFMSVK